MNERTYHDWLITEPTTRRMVCGGLWWPGAFDETDGEGLRLFLTGDSDGEDNLYVVPSSQEDFDRASRVIMQHALPWPATRFGTWRRYHAIVAWARAVFELLGYEPTDDEAALFAALEEYSRQAPARYVMAA